MALTWTFLAPSLQVDGGELPPNPPHRPGILPLLLLSGPTLLVEGIEGRSSAQSLLGFWLWVGGEGARSGDGGVPIAPPDKGKSAVAGIYPSLFPFPKLKPASFMPKP